MDTTSECAFDYSGGRRAELIASFREDRPREAVITGTKGVIRIPHFSGTDQAIVTGFGRAPETIQCEPSGFEHEIREVHRCLRDGRIESSVMPLAETLEILRTLDTLRAQWGVKYPGE